MNGNYCPKCKSRLYPGDNEYIEKAGVCSHCVTYDNTPDKRFQAAFKSATTKPQNKMTRSKLKEVIKQIVRESLSEHEYKTMLTEVSPPGEKAERMIQHIKASLRDTHPNWSEDKVTSVAIATAWKAHNAGSIQEVALEGWEGTVKEMKKEKGIENPWALAHWMKGKGYKFHKDEQVGANVVAGEEMDEAGLTSEKKEKWIKKALDPEHKGYCTPMTKPTCTPRRKALARRFKKGLEEMGLRLGKMDEGSAKTQNTSYKVAPNPSARVQKDDKDRLAPDDPRLTEDVSSYNTGPENRGAQYKVVAPHLYTDAEEDKLRNVQTDPHVTVERQAEPKVTENHRVQHRSYTTTGKDPWQDPNVVRDPETPMVEDKKK